LGDELDAAIGDACFGVVVLVGVGPFLGKAFADEVPVGVLEREGGASLAIAVPSLAARAQADFAAQLAKAAIKSEESR